MIIAPRLSKYEGNEQGENFDLKHNKLFILLKGQCLYYFQVMDKTCASQQLYIRCTDSFDEKLKALEDEFLSLDEKT